VYLSCLQKMIVHTQIEPVPVAKRNACWTWRD